MQNTFAALPEFSLFAMAEHQACYFHGNTEDKKNGADPDILGCQKHQDPAQNEQCDGQESFGSGISDHGIGKFFATQSISL